MQIWKEVLCLGRQRDTHGNWFTVTRRDIRQAHRNVGRMLSRGVPIPAVWEHQPIEAANAEEWRRRWLADYARNTFAHIGDRRINGRGNLDLRHDLTSDRDAEQLVKTRFVSPKLYPGYSDSRGGTYQGATIAHVAATPTPVQYWQKPFELSRSRPLYLSYEGPPVADDNADKPADKGCEGDLKTVIDALRETGMMIPDEVKSLADLVIAIKAGGGSGGDNADLEDDLPDEPDPEPDTPTDAATSAGGAPPLLMSATLAAPFAKLTRKDLDSRINRLFTSGRISRPTAIALKREAGAVSLSFTRAGDLVPNKLAAKIEAYEELPSRSVWAKQGGQPLDLSTVSAGDPPRLGDQEDPAMVARMEANIKRHNGHNGRK